MTSIAVLFAVALLPPFAVILVHECGHAVAGLLNGMRCDLLVTGPFAFRRVHGKLKPSWNRSLLLAGGAVLMLPSDGRDLRRRVTWMIAGGPLASLALAIGGYTIHLALGHAPVSQLCGFIAILSLAIFLATAIPSHLGLPSDGSRLITLLRGGAKAEEMCAMFIKLAAQPQLQPTGSSTLK